MKEGSYAEQLGVKAWTGQFPKQVFWAGIEGTQDRISLVVYDEHLEDLQNFDILSVYQLGSFGIWF